MFFPLYKMFLVVEDEDRMQELLRGLRSSATGSGMDDAVYGLLILAGIALLILLLSMLVNMRQRGAGRDSPRGLFLSLCRAHKLKWRRALAAVAIGAAATRKRARPAVFGAVVV